MVLDLLLPPQCLACGAAVDRTGALCAERWSRTAFIVPPLCNRCGLPFEVDEGEDVLCGACLDTPPDFDGARAALRYEGLGRDLVLGFKLSDRTYTAPALAGWMARADADLIAECDLAVPVPLHRWRLLARRYNQAALLAQLIGRKTGIVVQPDLLERVRPTKVQTRLSAAARVANVQGAFRVRPRFAGRISGARVLLIDDVLTTGATASACARALREAGAAQTAVLTLARRVLGAT